MSRTSTSSWCSMSKVVDSGSRASWARPSKTSSYMRATREGVSSRPSRSGSSPIAARISRTAASMRGLSTAISAPRPVGAGGAVVPVAPAAAGLAAVRGDRDLRALASRAGPRGRVRLHRLARVMGLGARRGGGAAHGGRREGGALGAGDPHLARRLLLHVPEDLCELALVQRLLLQQLLDEAVEHVAVLDDHRPGLVQGVVQKGADLLVHEARRLGAEAGRLALLHAHEDLVLLAGERDLAHGPAHAQLHHHGARDLRRVLQVRAGAGGDVVEDALLHGVAAHRVGEAVQQLVAGLVVA